MTRMQCRVQDLFEGGGGGHKLKITAGGGGGGQPKENKRPTKSATGMVGVSCKISRCLTGFLANIQDVNVG